MHNFCILLYLWPFNKDVQFHLKKNKLNEKVVILFIFTKNQLLFVNTSGSQPFGIRVPLNQIKNCNHERVRVSFWFLLLLVRNEK